MLHQLCASSYTLATSCYSLHTCIQSTLICRGIDRSLYCLTHPRLMNLIPTEILRSTVFHKEGGGPGISLPPPPPPPPQPNITDSATYSVLVSSIRFPCTESLYMYMNIYICTHELFMRMRASKHHIVHVHQLTRQIWLT